MIPSGLFRQGEPRARLQGTGVYQTRPLPDGDLLIQTDASLTRVDAEGKVAWSVSGPSYTESVTVGQDALYASQPGQVSRLDPDTGQALWTQTTSDSKYRGITSLALGPQGQLYASTDRSRAVQLDPATGEKGREFCVHRTWVEQWLNTYSVGVATGPDGAVVIQEAFKMECREPDGRHRWSHKFSECVDNPIYCRDRWLVPDNHGKLTALSPSTGRVLWETSSYVSNGGNHGVDCVTPGPPGIVYFHPRANQLMALDEKSGRVLASHGSGFAEPMFNRGQYLPSLGRDGRLYVRRTGTDHFEVLDPVSLRLLETQPTSLSNPILASGTEWLISQDGPGVLRLDPLHPPPVKLDAPEDRGAARLGETERGVVVGGVTVPFRAF